MWFAWQQTTATEKLHVISLSQNTVGKVLEALYLYSTV